MKKTMAALVLAGVVGAGADRAAAGDREWATAGKILTGLVAGHVLAHAAGHGPVYYGTVVHAAPPVCVAPAPVVVYAPPPPLVYAPAPVVYAPPVHIYSPPVIGFHFGFGHRPHHHHHYRHPHHRPHPHGKW